MLLCNINHIIVKEEVFQLGGREIEKQFLFLFYQM